MAWDRRDSLAIVVLVPPSKGSSKFPVFANYVRAFRDIFANDKSFSITLSYSNKNSVLEFVFDLRFHNLILHSFT